MRIVILTHTFFPVVGGAEVGIHEIATRLAVTHDVVVLTPIGEDHSDSYSAEASRSSDYTIVRYSNPLLTGRFGRLGRLLAQIPLRELRELRRLKREERADVVNLHFIHPFGLLTILSRYLLGLPVVLSLVGRTDVLAEHRGLRKVMSRLSIRGAAETTEISSYCSRGSWAEGRLELLYYGADLDTYSPDADCGVMRRRFGISTDSPVLLAVQRLQSVKRVDMVIAAFDEVAREDDDIHLVVVGRGEEEARLRALALSSQPTRIHFAGYVAEDDLPSYYAESDLFVSHSENETFGVMFAQAMASGLPIVAARTSCIPDIVLDGVNGALVTPGNPQEFGTAIEALTGDLGRRKSISRENVARARELFNWDKTARTLETYVQRVRSRT
ncbi:glycosyltransferase family 4 protein [Nocardioides conyzicola]|uniref:Glycosyltransferase family 1 protein n=1 Tax=Nocardioides conyzicola TaxID=1651781 RepID=A0ABP8XHS6_9ACTN